MNIEKLIEQLNEYAQSYTVHDDPDLIDTLKNSAIAFSMHQIENQALRNSVNELQTENEKLREKLEQVKKERDEAVERLREWEKFETYLLVHNFLPPEKWRGIKED